VVCTLYGRPLMMHPLLTRHALQLTSVIDDKHLTRHPLPPGAQPSGEPSLMACYHYSLILQETMADILVTCYQNNQGNDLSFSGSRGPIEVTDSSLMNKLKAGEFQDVLSLHRKLNDWYDSLPSYLRTDCNPPSSGYVYNASSNVSNTAIIARQANVLKAR